MKSLDALDKKDLQEMKGFKKPPELVVTVVNAVCLLMGRKENWDEGLKVLSNANLIDDLKKYDKDALAVDKKLTNKLQKYIKMEDFVKDKVSKVSKAATSLCMWVRAMDVYGRVSREIEPKKLKLADAVQAKVAKLEADLEAAKKKAKKLEDDMETATLKLGRAEKLLAGLGEEAVRWTAASEILEASLKFLIGNIVVASGFIAYIGPFTALYRGDLSEKWVKYTKECDLVADPGWELAKVLVDPAEVRQWNLWGLPP